MKPYSNIKNDSKTYTIYFNNEPVGIIYSKKLADKVCKLLNEQNTEK